MQSPVSQKVAYKVRLSNMLLPDVSLRYYRRIIMIHHLLKSTSQIRNLHMI
jgi:hypothetical protein